VTAADRRQTTHVLERRDVDVQQLLVELDAVKFVVDKAVCSLSLALSVTPNAGEIVVDILVLRFWISPPGPEIFAIEV